MQNEIILLLKLENNLNVLIYVGENNNMIAIKNIRNINLRSIGIESNLLDIYPCPNLKFLKNKINPTTIKTRNIAQSKYNMN